VKLSELRQDEQKNLQSYLKFESKQLICRTYFFKFETF